LIETMDSKRKASPKAQKRVSSPRSKGVQTLSPQDGSVLASTTPPLLDSAEDSDRVPMAIAQSPAPLSKGRRIQGYETDWQRWDQLAQQFGDQKEAQALLFHQLLQMAESQSPESQMAQTGALKTAASFTADEAIVSSEQTMAELVTHIPSLLSTMTSLTVQFQQNQQQQQQLNLVLAQVLQALTSGSSQLLSDFRQTGRKSSEVSAVAKESFKTLDSQNLKKSHAKGSAEEKLKRAFEAIVNYNEMPNHTNADMWAINQNALAELTGCNRPAIKHFLKHYAAAIELHHQANGLLPRHNYAHGKLGTKITDIIAW
jgi:hypothetical protein